MAQSNQMQVTTSVPSVPAEHRTRLRVGFALCSAAFALALVYIIGHLGAVNLASSSDAQFVETHDFELKVAGNMADAAIDALLIAGLACLYLTSNGRRWRMASTVALGLLGADVAVLCVQVVGTDPALLEVTGDVGHTLSWVVLWMIAVLAAEAAESIERLDITHQTEVTGRLILWGGVAWLIYLIWSFEPEQLGKRAEAAGPDEFSLVFFYASRALLLFSLGRTMFFCGGLATALSPNQDQTPPGQPI